MQQPRLGFHTFRKLETDETPYQNDQSCIVVGLNLDGTVNLVAFEADGQQFLYERATIVKSADGQGFHYQPQLEKEM